MAYEFYITPEEYVIAERNGISKYNLDRRVRGLGWKKERALKQPLVKRCSLVKKWEDIAVENGIKRPAFMHRVRRGWGLKEAATTPTLTKSENLKRMWSSMHRAFTDAELEQAKSIGVSSSHLHDRVKRLGWSKEKALTTPVMTNEESMKLAQAASPFREMNDISANMKKRPNAIQHRRDGNIHANQI